MRRHTDVPGALQAGRRRPAPDGDTGGSALITGSSAPTYPTRFVAERAGWYRFSAGPFPVVAPGQPRPNPAPAPTPRPPRPGGAPPSGPSPDAPPGGPRSMR